MGLAKAIRHSVREQLQGEGGSGGGGGCEGGHVEGHFGGGGEAWYTGVR